MSDYRRSGHLLPQDFTVVSTAFEKVVNAREIGRQSEEAEWLARQALRLFMSGTRNEWDLEARLKEFNLPIDYTLPAEGGGTTVVDFMPELWRWARSLTPSPSEATALTERTLEYTIDHMDEFVATADLKGWLVRVMLELRLGRSRSRRRT